MCLVNQFIGFYLIGNFTERCFRADLMVIFFIGNKITVTYNTTLNINMWKNVYVQLLYTVFLIKSQCYVQLLSNTKESTCLYNLEQWPGFDGYNLLCCGWGRCPAIFWTMPIRNKLFSFCGTLMNFQKFGWQDSMWPWHPSALLFLYRAIRYLFCGTCSSVELASLVAEVERFFSTYQCRCLQSIQVDHLHLHYGLCKYDLRTLQNLGSHHLVVEMWFHPAFSDWGKTLGPHCIIVAG